MRRLLGIIFLLINSALALAAVEIAMRVVDGYRVTSLRLERARQRAAPAAAATSGAGSQKWNGDYDALPYAEKLPLAAGVDLAWFTAALPEFGDPTPDRELAARMDRYKGGIDERVNYEWNARHVSSALCRGEHPASAEALKQYDDAFMFEPLDGAPEPPYRFLQHARYTSHLRTNLFGWRSPDIALVKPASTIRVAFVGASTTVGNHGFPYSYPEQVDFFLRQWIAARHPGVSIEVLNAGREGINSRSLPAIIRQEVVPVEPDLVYYDYDGANQFWPGNFVNTPVAALGPPPAVRNGWLVTHSAVGIRVSSLLRRTVAGGSEPPKPRLDVQWPADLDERDPNLAHPRLPVDLPQLLADLEAARRETAARGSALVMTSIGWLVDPGMELEPDRDAAILTMLNTTFWPYSYAHIRRYLDFKARVFRKYAAANNIDFVDAAASFPRDPRLFEDAIHQTRAGTRLHAWLVFNGLVPIIERGLTAGRWPRPAALHLSRHPAFDGRHLVPIADVRAACETQGPSKHE